MLDRFLQLYQTLDAQHLHLLSEIYTDDVVFVDPAHTLNGQNALHQYFYSLYQNLSAIEFEYDEVLQDGNQASIYWRMTYAHPGIAKGKSIEVRGNSLIRFNDEGKVYYHRDVFDLGEMLYEHVPVLGFLTRYCKARLAEA